MRSREYFSLTGNIRGDSPEAVARRVTSHTEVAGLRGPTISKVYPKLGGEEGWYAATVVVQSKLLLQAIDALRRAGAGDVSVAPLRYMFQSKCWSFEALRRQLSDRQRTTSDSPSMERRMIGPLIARYDDVDEARRELLARRSLGDAPLPAPVVQKIREVFGRDLTPTEVVAKIIADVRADGDAAIRRYTEAIDGRPVDSLVVSAGRDRRGRRRRRPGGHRRPRGGCRPDPQVPRARPPQQLDRARGRRRARPGDPAAAPRRHLRPGRPGAVPVVGADGGGARARGRRPRGRHGVARGAGRRDRAGAAGRREGGRRRHGLPRGRRPGDRRAGVRHRVDRPGSTRSSGRATSSWRWRSSRCTAQSRSTGWPARPSACWSPTTRPTRRFWPPT